MMTRIMTVPITMGRERDSLAGYPAGPGPGGSGLGGHRRAGPSPGMQPFNFAGASQPTLLSVQSAVICKPSRSNIVCTSVQYVLELERMPNRFKMRKT